ncbi:MAG: alkaline phosphatase family protein [Marmoricola sp.]
MTAPRSLAAATAVVVALVVGTACDAPLAPDRESKAAGEATPKPAPTPAPPASTSPDPSLSADRAEAEAKAKEARRKKKEAARRAATPVIAISVDGLNPTALSQLGAGRLPNVFALIRGGASTLNARTEQELTETLPNHTGMLTGRPVQGPAGHEVDFNTDPGGTTVSSHAGRPIASVFDVVHAAGRTTAMYASKSKFALYQRSWASSIDRAVIDEDNDQLVSRIVADLGSQPAAFTFVHLSAPDSAGHDSGFMGAEYLRAVERVDGLLGRIRQAVTTSPGLEGRATLVITADHGGRGSNGHADAAKIDDYRIPFIVSGPGVTPGSDLYALNPDYRDPGTSRPSYDGAQPVRNADVANLSIRLLGLAPVPGSVFGVSDPLDVR